jgi:hypothetical protein
MNKIYIIISLTITSSITNIFGQSRFPIKPTSEWRINYEFWGTVDPEDHVNGDEEYKYFVNGDTLIHSKSYFKLYKSGMMYLDSPFKYENKYVGAIRDTINKILFIPSKKTQIDTLYDFDLKLSEFFQQIQVYKIDTLDDGRKYFLMDVMNVHCGSQNAIVEGIGWLGGLLEGNSCSGHPGVRGSHLLCYSEDGKSVYTNTVAMDAKETCNNPAVNINHSDQRNIIFYISKQNLNISFCGNMSTEKRIVIYNIIGNVYYNSNCYNLELDIDISCYATGTYFIKVIEANKMTIKKFVKY